MKERNVNGYQNFDGVSVDTLIAGRAEIPSVRRDWLAKVQQLMKIMMQW